MHTFCDLEDNADFEWCWRMGESGEGLSDSLEFDCHHDEDEKVIDNADDKDDIDED